MTWSAGCDYRICAFAGGDDAKWAQMRRVEQIMHRIIMLNADERWACNAVMFDEIDQYS